MTNSSPIRRPGATPPPSSADPLMPFGKFKGSRLKDLDADYLLWVALLPDLHHPLLGHILREMARRIEDVDQRAAKTAEERGR